LIAPLLDGSAWALLGLAAFAAGVVDAVGGGGGLIQVPALFACLPGATPALLFGTNKMASSVGTAGAAWQYAGSVTPPWRVVAASMLAAFVAAWLGALALALIPTEPLRKALPWLLLALLIFTVVGSGGLHHQPKHAPQRELGWATAGSGLIGFYDGAFGPGAGAFYKMLFVRGLGFDFLHAAAPSKFANLASNLGALTVFAWQGQIHWLLGLGMALSNFVGGQLGSRIGLKYGNDLIRRVFVLLVGVLIVKSFADAYGV
jgi:uncharacterized membrane protein YfcA